MKQFLIEVLDLRRKKG